MTEWRITQHERGCERAMCSPPWNVPAETLVMINSVVMRGFRQLLLRMGVLG